MRMFIVGLVAVLFVSAGCESSNAAPKAGSAVKAPAAKGSATDPWGAQPPAKAGSTNGSATAPAQKPAVPEKPAATEKSEGSDAKSAKDDGAKKSNASGEGNWQCTASSSVRVCGFAGACNYQMVFGNGWGKDRFFAQKQAKSSCEASARAKGAVAVCVVQCSVR